MARFEIGQRLDIEFKPHRYPYEKVPLYCYGNITNVENGIIELDNCSIGRIITMKVYYKDSKVQVITLNEDNTDKEVRTYELINIEHVV